MYAPNSQLPTILLAAGAMRNCGCFLFFSVPKRTLHSLNKDAKPCFENIFSAHLLSCNVHRTDLKQLKVIVA